MNIFGRKTARDQLKESQKDVKGNLRDLERDMAELKREEAKLTDEIRAASRDGNEASTRILAKQMVRLRNHMTKLQVTMAGLRGVNTSLTTAATSSSMATSVQKAGKALAAVGDRLDPVATQQQTKQFAREDAKQQAVQSLMDEAMLDTLGSEDLDEGAKVLVQQILDEAGVELKASLASVPAGVPGLPEGSQAVPATAEHEDDGELSRQLAALRAA